MAVGAGAPDLFHAFSSIGNFYADSQRGIVLAILFTVCYATVLRTRAADGLFGSLPDLGPLQVHHYRALKLRNPHMLVTLFSSIIGVYSHVLLDSFTHPNRWGSNLFRLNKIAIGDVSGAEILQYLSHPIGSLIGLALLVVVVSDRHMADWYGSAALARSRSAPIGADSTRITIMVSVSSLGVGIAWGILQQQAVLFTTGLSFALGLLVAGWLNSPRPNGPFPYEAVKSATGKDSCQHFDSFADSHRGGP